MCLKQMMMFIHKSNIGIKSNIEIKSAIFSIFRRQTNPAMQSNGSVPPKMGINSAASQPEGHSC